MSDTKAPRELTIAAATKKVVAIRRGIPDDFAAAKRKVLDGAATREAKVLERVPEEVRHVVRKKADAECPAEPQAFVDVEIPDLPGVAPLTDEERATLLAVDDPPVQPQGEQVPDRLKEPLSPERLAVARGGKR